MHERILHNLVLLASQTGLLPVGPLAQRATDIIILPGFARQNAQLRTSKRGVVVSHSTSFEVRKDFKRHDKRIHAFVVNGGCK